MLGADLSRGCAGGGDPALLLSPDASGGQESGDGGRINLTSPSSGYEMRPQWECHLHSSQKGLQQWRKTHLMSPAKSLAKWEVIS